MSYREKLRAPASWWAIALVFGLTFVTAVGFYLGPVVAAGAGVVTTVGIATALAVIGGTTVQVDERGLTVGRSLLEWPYVGDATVLDAAATHDRLGPGADARAHVVQRPYIAESVEVVVADAADPHPYWLVSTRQPAQLAAAILRGRRAGSAG